MAVLSSRAQERRSREIRAKRARTSGEAARKISCFHPNLLAVSLPSPAFITWRAQPKPPCYAGYCLLGKKGCFPSTKNLGLKFWKFQVPNGTVYSGSTDPSQGTAHLVIALVSRIQKSSTWDNTFVKWNYRHFSSTDWNDQTGQSGPLSKVILIILVEPNWNGPFPLISNQNFQNFGLNERCPKSAWIDEYAPLSIVTCSTSR